MRDRACAGFGRKVGDILRIRERSRSSLVKGLLRASIAVSPLLVFSSGGGFAQSGRGQTMEAKASYVCGSSALYLLPQETLSDCVRLGMVDSNIVIKAYDSEYPLACGGQIYGREALEERRRYIRSEPGRTSRDMLQEISREAPEMEERVSMFYDFYKERIENDVDWCNSDYYGTLKKALFYTAIAGAVTAAFAFVKNRI